MTWSKYGTFCKFKQCFAVRLGSGLVLHQGTLCHWTEAQVQLVCILSQFAAQMGLCGLPLQVILLFHAKVHSLDTLSQLYGTYLQGWESDLLWSDSHDMCTCLGYAVFYQAYQHQVWYRDIPSSNRWQTVFSKNDHSSMFTCKWTRLRNPNICSNNKDFDKHVITLAGHFLRRKYPIDILKKQRY